MKLRNKHTGELKTITEVIHEAYTKHELTSLSKLNEDWEDYEPKEPLIKDEKIRKAVRAWAEVNGITELIYDEYCGILDNNGGDVITFNDYRKLDFLSDHKIYTIAELCGEEE